MWWFDQVFSGFDPALPDGGAGAFLHPRCPVLANTDVVYALEFPEFVVDTYENLAAGPRDLGRMLQRNVCFWSDPRRPGSLRYWSLAELAALIRALRARGVAHVFARTFLTFEGRVGQGRFLRWENSPHTQAFEWRRADEFCRRHPEVRDPVDHLLNWDALLRPDPLYGIGPDTTVGRWFTERLFGFLGELGFTGVRLGDGSYGGALTRGQPGRAELIARMHRDLRAAAQARGLTLLTSLGPYWTFDAWGSDLGVPFEPLPEVADLVLTQPLECWTDRYGITYTHNGEYFSAGSAQVHALVNAAAVPGASFVRGLDVGDPIENWHVLDAMPLRQAVASLALWTRVEKGWQPAHAGLYAFWSDELTPAFYGELAQLAALLARHQPARIHGPCLAVPAGERPHVYTLGDFFEGCGYGLAHSAPARTLRPHPESVHVFFLPRRADAPPVLDESPLLPEDQLALDALMRGPGTLIVFGGALDPTFQQAFGVEALDGPFAPTSWRGMGREGPWHDRAEDCVAPGMAGQPEKFVRRNQLRYRAQGAESLAVARDGRGRERALVTVQAKPCGGVNILVCGLPAELAPLLGEALIAGPARLPYRILKGQGAAISSVCWSTPEGKTLLVIFRTDAVVDPPVSVALHLEAPLQPVPLHLGVCTWNEAVLLMPPQSHAWFSLEGTDAGP